jgi:hypothetical protein
MSLGANKARLRELTASLFHRWEGTQECWRDRRAAAFEETYLRDLKSDVDKAATALDGLEKLLLKMRNDCE